MHSPSFIAGLVIGAVVTAAVLHWWRKRAPNSYDAAAARLKKAGDKIDEKL